MRKEIKAVLSSLASRWKTAKIDGEVRAELKEYIRSMAPWTEFKNFLKAVDVLSSERENFKVLEISHGGAKNDETTLRYGSYAVEVIDVLGDGMPFNCHDYKAAQNFVIGLAELMEKYCSNDVAFPLAVYAVGSLSVTPTENTLEIYTPTRYAGAFGATYSDTAEELRIKESGEVYNPY
jgi:hypothetical protein